MFRELEPPLKAIDPDSSFPEFYDFNRFQKAYSISELKFLFQPTQGEKPSLLIVQENDCNYKIAFADKSRKLILFEDSWPIFHTKREYDPKPQSLAATFTQRSNLCLSEQYHTVRYNSKGNKIREEFTHASDAELSPTAVAEKYFLFRNENKLMQKLKKALNPWKALQDDPDFKKVKQEIIACCNANLGIKRIRPPNGSGLVF